MVLLVNNLDEKTSQRRQDIHNFESMHMLFVICTCGTTLHSCYNFALMLQLCTHVTTLHSCYNFALMLQLCTCGVTTVHLRYMRMHFFSASQMPVPFLFFIIIHLNPSRNWCMVYNFICKCLNLFEIPRYI